MAKRTKLTMGLCIVVILTALFYWFFVPKTVKTFPEKHELIRVMNATHPNAKVKQIQNILSVDQKHVFVPFLSKDGEYGTSYWKWQINKWKLLNIDTSGEPKVWKINKEDPSTYRLVWNLHKEDKIAEMKFYLLGNRNFYITNGIENYYPKIQMQKTINLHSVSYGAEKLPSDWVSVMNSHVRVKSNEAAKFTMNLELNTNLSFGWIPYEESGEVARTLFSVGGNGFTNDDIELDYVRQIEEQELE